MATMVNWLNSLTASEVTNLFHTMRNSVGTNEHIQILGGGEGFTTEGLRALDCLPTNVPRTGGWYADWACCDVINLSLRGGHPRWQPRVLAGGLTPANPTAVGRLIKDVLREQSWNELKLQASGSGQVKIPCHHLAFLAFVMGGVGIPDNMGAGASMSHLCDTVGCIRQDHLELTLQHMDNLERQRCRGVTLIVTLDLIIHEVPCDHGRGLSAPERIASSCRRVKIIWLPDASVRGLLTNHQEIAFAMAASSSPPSSQQ